jgi:hypothetical protein
VPINVLYDLGISTNNFKLIEIINNIRNRIPNIIEYKEEKLQRDIKILTKKKPTKSDINTVSSDFKTILTNIKFLITYNIDLIKLLKYKPMYDNKEWKFYFKDDLNACKMPSPKEWKKFRKKILINKLFIEKDYYSHFYDVLSIK